MHTHYLTASALIFFEYLLTFDQEVRLFWGKKLTGAVVLFVINRYTTLIYTIYSMLMALVPATRATVQVSLLHFTLWERCKCTYCADLSRGNGVLTVTIKQLHWHSVHSDLGTSRAQFVFDVMQYIPAGGMYNHSCLIMCPFSRVLSSVFESPNLCYQQKHHDIRVDFLSLHGSIWCRHGMVWTPVSSIELHFDRNFQFQLYTLHEVWSPVLRSWTAFSNVAPGIAKTLVISSLPWTDFADTFSHAIGVSMLC